MLVKSCLGCAAKGCVGAAFKSPCSIVDKTNGTFEHVRPVLSFESLLRVRVRIVTQNALNSCPDVVCDGNNVEHVAVLVFHLRVHEQFPCLSHSLRDGTILETVEVREAGDTPLRLRFA